ncbi:transcription initiation at TATA-containing promoter protein [Oleoguttula sp. CCFEE 5521]
MASDLAQGAAVPQLDGADALPPPQTDVPQTNGSHDTMHQQLTPPNQDAFLENGSLSLTKEATLNLKEPASLPDAPVVESVLPEHHSTGIAPVTDFIPTDAPNTDYATPDPSAPMGYVVAEVDGVVHDQVDGSVDEVAATPPAAIVEPALPESLPAPPRSLDAELPPSVESAMSNGSADAAEATSDADAKQDITPVDSVAQDTVSSSLVRNRDEFEEDAEPVAKRAKLEDSGDEKPHAPVQSSEPAAPVEPVDTTMEDAPLASPQPELPSTDTAATAPAETATTNAAKYSTAAVTLPQKNFLIDKLKNNKKTKHAMFFLEPVDPVKLNIPTYHDIIKHPMDLGTLETKLKNNEYPSVQAFADDFHLIVDNCRTFNGEMHAVTVAAKNMLAYFDRFMASVPPANLSSLPKQAKKQSPVPKAAPPRRETRPPPPPPAPPVSRSESFALQSDGTPQIRRDSQTKRPARAIKPPPNRELTYAKPRRKEHMLELKFCEFVLEELRNPVKSPNNHIFLAPVDPVALNIPHYRQIVKDPMDLATMGQKLKQGQYSKAREFKNDFDLMIENCLKFNPIGNPVRDIGIEFRRVFEALWLQKDKWERNNKPKPSGSSGSGGGGDSDADEDEEEDEDDEDDAPDDGDAKTIAALSKQLATLQNQLGLMVEKKGAKAAKSKSGAAKSHKKKPPVPAFKPAPAKSSSAPKAKPKKLKPVTYEEKQEISSAVEQMNEGQIETLTGIITTNCKKYANMGAEMELEIDDLPDDVQRLLLKHVRSIFGRRTTTRMSSPDDIAAVDDDDFEPSERVGRGGVGGSSGNKRKKHKPMGKREQQASIDQLKDKLNAFNQPIGSESQSPASYGNQAQGGETSGDEPSDESEEE